MKSKTRDAIDNQGTDIAPDNVGEKNQKTETMISTYTTIQST
jgi:hypothetical protein